MITSWKEVLTMSKTSWGKTLVAFVHLIGRSLEVLADIIGFFTERRLSFRGILIALGVISALACLFFWFVWCNMIQQSAAAEQLVLLRGDVISDLMEYGRCDLGKVRERFESKYEVPLLWTKLSHIVQDADYRGRVICCAPRNHFGILATGTVGVTLHGRDRDGFHILRIEGVEGAPDFIREKGPAP